MKLLSLFSGIGAFESALDRLGIRYDLVNYCEIDKYASKSYSVMHGVSEDKNLWDITKVDTALLPSNIDLITYGFPCQDISIAGKLKGFGTEDERTRSGLFFDALRIIEDVKPKIAIAENVKNLTGKRFAKEFEIVLSSLEEAGYVNYWKVLNAKDYGVAQNRERVFIISIRKDIEHGYVFPKSFPLVKRMKDYLEDCVADKYYINNDKSRELIRKLILNGTLPADREGIDLSLNQPKTIDRANVITARDRGISNRQSENTGVIESRRIPMHGNYNKIEKINPNVSKTINARDYKGFGTSNQTQNGVIECQRK